MNRMIVALALSGIVASTSLAESYKLTGDNTKIGFVGTKSDGKHEGGFKKLSGAAEVTGGELKSLDVTIDVESIFSDDAKLTSHLKAPDFFNVKEHGSAKFKVTEVKKSDKIYTLIGELTMLGKTKPLEMPASVEVKDGVLSISSEFKIDRTNWGMNYGKGKVNDEVLLKVSVTAKK